MINRRTMLAGLAVATSATTVRAQGVSEIVYAAVPAENASGVSDRFAPFLAYLSKEIGVKVTLRIANDYAAVTEGHSAGNVQIGYHGPAPFQRTTGPHPGYPRHSQGPD